MGTGELNAIFYGSKGIDTRTPAIRRALQIAGAGSVPEGSQAALQEYVRAGRILIYEHIGYKYPQDNLIEYETVKNGCPAIEDGLLKRLCEKAVRENEKGGREQYVMLVFCDDIWCADGLKELLDISFHQLEIDKRMYEKNWYPMLLPLTRQYFSMPANVHLICTLQAVPFDNSFYRRFEIVEVFPDYKKLDRIVDGVNVAAVVSDINFRLRYQHYNYAFGEQLFDEAASWAEVAEIIKRKISELEKAEDIDLKNIYSGWPV